jgi:hypothetical protein
MGMTRWQLISGEDISIQGIGTIVQPRLKDLRSETGIGFSTFFTYLFIFARNIREEALDNPDAKQLCDEMDAILKRDFTTFDFYTGNKTVLLHITKALSFFIKESIEYREDMNSFCVFSPDKQEPIGFISHENYQVVADAICEVCNIKVEHEELPKNKSKTLMDIWMKLRKGRKSMKKSADKNLSLENLVSKITARHPSYNYLNIWDLTIFQVYDTFQNMAMNEVFERDRLRWAAWGKDEYKNDNMWYAAHNS